MKFNLSDLYQEWGVCAASNYRGSIDNPVNTNQIGGRISGRATWRKRSRTVKQEGGGGGKEERTKNKMSQSFQ